MLKLYLLQSTVLPCLVSTLGVTRYAEADICWQPSAFCSKPSFCSINETDPQPISQFFSHESLLHRFASNCHLLPLCFACAVRSSRRSASSHLLLKTLSQQLNHINNIVVSREPSLRDSACVSDNRVIRFLVNTESLPSFARIRSHRHRAHSGVLPPVAPSTFVRTQQRASFSSSCAAHTLLSVWSNLHHHHIYVFNLLATRLQPGSIS